MRRTFGLPVAVLLISAGCSRHPAPQVAAPIQPTAPVSSVPVPAPVAPADPTAALLTEADRSFNLGERELSLGHLEQARAAFDKSLDILLDAPDGARVDPRLRTHFDRLVDRIAAHETLALQKGDGFTEKPSEPAAIDQLLEVATFAPPPPAGPGVEQAVQLDLAQTSHDIPIPLNERVLNYVELFQGRLREFLTGGLQRGSKYLPMVQSVFRAEGVPLDLAYVPLIESAFKPTALSRASARGMWQFMRGTAGDFGLKQDWYIDERADPEKATRAAARYFKQLYGMFSDWHLAMASYNGGPGRVQRAMKSAGVEDFWELTANERYLPRETREYVPMILAAMIIAKNPTQYGFEAPPIETLAYDKVEVDTAVDLRRVAEWTGASIDEIQALNPELRRWTTPLRFARYEMKVPAGTGPQLQARLATAGPSELTALKFHTVRRRESIALIARKLGVSRADLAEANGISQRAAVHSGQRLLIPRAPSAPLLASGPRADQPQRQAEAVVARRPTASPDEEDDVRITTHRVKRGESLYAIANAYDVSVADLRAWNRMKGTQLDVGDKLTIRVSRTRAAQ
ncbi:Membrane-bound lytic murein transglycosylase D precursor [Luteitalea pratensis]|uniref:Membrane-bound lytic murein transglycosylase D n=1 Tax=Luteitalea pratensis TaxID=1855912 RepID=A0A143PQZ9_LUTPR|nr:lytic transglycosylase domain-containing protein [Luteitalea pratensis]AMY10234.1 Membrane-bound lytic murein transglycosylase D precursor [Luteitalea pratensis]